MKVVYKECGDFGAMWIKLRKLKQTFCFSQISEEEIRSFTAVDPLTLEKKQLPLTVTLPETMALLAEKGEATEFYINGRSIHFEKAYEDEPSLWMADISGLVQEGINDYEVVLHWHQSEEIYYALFGEGVTESLRNCIVYDSEIEDVYLVGKVGVYCHGDYEDYNDNAVCGHDFYIGVIPTKIGESTKLTRQQRRACNVQAVSVLCTIIF